MKAEEACAALGPETVEKLIRTAMQMRDRSYVPYSRFAVGAALLTADDRVFLGCNIENASYGATNCAERTALFKAVSEGARQFTAIAIAAEKAMPWPCGLCRQALYEFAPDLRVIVCCGEEIQETTLSALLPHGFGPANGLTEILGKE